NALVYSPPATTKNLANNSARDTESGINIDKTAPTAAAGQSPAANANGWNKTDVTVTFTGTDALSTIDSCTAAVTLSAEGTAQTAGPGTCTDKAGNVSTPVSKTGINIDKTAPTASAAQLPLANANGWNKTDVTVTFTGTDALSTIDSCTLPVTLSPDGTAQTAGPGTCTDKAGNVSAPVSKTGINIDKTNPSISGSPSPLANAHGWNRTDVTVSFSCSDALSGLAPGSPPASTLLSSEGAGQSMPGTCYDLAGNSASATVSGINIDKTATNASAAQLPLANSHGWNNTDVTVTFTGADALSTIDFCTAPVTLSAEGTAQTAGPGTCTDKAGNVSAPVSKTGINRSEERRAGTA